MSFNPNKPFNSLAPLPPKLADLDSKKILKKAITANRAVAELKGIGQTIPNQAMLVNTLVLQEAKASSEIENIFTTNDALFKAIATNSRQADSPTKEVLRYRQALWAGYESLKKKPLLTSNLFINIVQTIKENKAGIRKTPGTIIGNAQTGKVIFTPPEGEKILRDKLHDLEKFIHINESLDPLVKLALIHYQFEAIHPFYDGNGRTGRIINILYLVQNGLLDIPVLYLSKYIIEHKQEYYRLLRRVTEANEWEPWILYMLNAVETTSLFTRQRISDIRLLMEETLIVARKKLPARVYSKELIEVIFSQPYAKVQMLVNANIAERKTAAEYLIELEKVGILSLHKTGRENLFINTKLYKLLSQ